MNISPINNTNNNLSFGIRYNNKAAWNKEILSYIEKSKLVSDVDKKYPDAILTYIKKDLTDVDSINCEPNYLASLVIKLAKNKVSTYSINSHTTEGADKALLSYIRNLTIEDVENASKPTAEFPRMTLTVYKKFGFFGKLVNSVRNFFA